MAVEYKCLSCGEISSSEEEGGASRYVMKCSKCGRDMYRSNAVESPVEVWDGVRRLRGDQRQVIVMRFIDGLSYVDIAQVLDKRVGAVRVILFRALSTLRRLLEDDTVYRLELHNQSQRRVAG